MRLATCGQLGAQTGARQLTARGPAPLLLILAPTVALAPVLVPAQFTARGPAHLLSLAALAAALAPVPAPAWLASAPAPTAALRLASLQRPRQVLGRLC